MPLKPRKIEEPIIAVLDLVDKLQVLIRTRLWAQILFAMALGIATGLVLSPADGGLLSPREAQTAAGWLALPGHLFLGLIQMVVVPLVVSSIMLGINSSKDPAYLRRIGLRILPYFVATTAIAVCLGIAAATLLNPGEYIDSNLVQKALAEKPDLPAAPAGSAAKKTMPELIAGLIPVDPVRAIISRSMLELVIFAILMGVALLSIDPERARPIRDLMVSVQEISMKVVSWAMLLAPFAVFGLLAQITLLIGLDALLGMSVYVGSVLLGLASLMGVYTLIAWSATGMAPWTFLARIRDVLLLAFSTSSSAAVMPLSIQTAQEKLGVRPAVSQFVVPLGATVNMDGTALYQVVAAVFLTQVFGIELSMGALVLLATTTVGASIGAPSTPGVGIVILATILEGIGVPGAGIALIIGVDRILDMARTSVNVAGDLTACAVMNKWLPGEGDASSSDPSPPDASPGSAPA